MSNESTNKENKPVEKVSTFTKLRASRKARLWFMGILLILIAVLFVFWTKARIALAVAFVVLLTVFGLEVSQNDWDLGTLMKTRSFEESKVSRDTEGNLLFDKLGNIVTDGSRGKKAEDYNCADFSTQPEAQNFFIKVGGTQHDVNRLDGNKDGEACEALPKGTN